MSSVTKHTVSGGSEMSLLQVYKLSQHRILAIGNRQAISIFFDFAFLFTSRKNVKYRVRKNVYSM